MTIQYNTGKEDYIAFRLYHYKNSKKTRDQKRSQIYVLLGSLAVLIYLAVYNENQAYIIPKSTFSETTEQKKFIHTLRQYLTPAA